MNGLLSGRVNWGEGSSWMRKGCRIWKLIFEETVSADQHFLKSTYISIRRRIFADVRVSTHSSSGFSFNLYVTGCEGDHSIVECNLRISLKAQVRTSSDIMMSSEPPIFPMTITESAFSAVHAMRSVYHDGNIWMVEYSAIWLPWLTELEMWHFIRKTDCRSFVLNRVQVNIRSQDKSSGENINPVNDELTSKSWS